MAYSSAKNVRILLGDPTEEDLSPDLLTLAQRKADAYINGRLRHLYTTPFTTVPAQIMGWSEDLSTYMILKNPAFRMRQPVDTAMVEKSLENAVAEINLCAHRKFRLDGVDPAIPIASNTDTYERIFNLDAPESWQLDPSQAIDIAAKRS